LSTQDKHKSVSRILGKSLNFGSFSGRQTIILGGAFSLTFFLTSIVAGLSIYTGLGAGVWAGLTCAFLSGAHPHKFWSKIYPFSVPYWNRGHARYSSPISKEHIGSKKVKVARNQSKYLNPIEDWLEIGTLCRLELERAPPFGCYILGGNDKDKNLDLSQLVIKSVFQLQGINSLLASQKQCEDASSQLETLFKEIDTSYVFRWRSFCDYTDTHTQFKERLQNPVSLECEYLDHASMARIQELTKQQKRKLVNLSVEIIFKPHLDTGGNQDWLDRWIESVKSFWQRKFENKGRYLDEQQLISILKQAHSAALRHLQILEEAGLKPVIQDEKQLWKELQRRVGAKADVGTGNVELPYWLVLDNTGLREEFGRDHTNQNSKKYPTTSNTSTTNSLLASQIHISTKLVQEQIPFADRRWVCISSPNEKGKNKYIGVLVLEEKPDGFWGDKGQIQNLWSIFCREEIYDVEVITEVTPADQNLVRLSQQLLTRNAISKDVHAQERGVVEVSAQINTETSVEAQRRLYMGDVPVNTSVVVLVYRDTPTELTEACRLIAGLVKQPAKLGREVEYAWRIWLQTLGVRREALLSTPYYRRLLFFASEVSGVCNLVQVASADKQGLELIAHESSCPIFIDFAQPKNVLVLGTTGSGKSILVASMIAECLALGMSFLIIDLPNADGTGTFGDLTHYFNGFYFDISRESNNLMQPLDLRHITNSDERQWRIQAHRSDVILIVTQLVIGGSGVSSSSDSSNSLSGFLAQTIESLIPLIIKAFYEDEDIDRRFVAARQGGLGSKEWTNTPTLRDLVEFVNAKHINLSYEDKNVEKALYHIKLRLQYWLSSAIGQAISNPSTFDIDSGAIQLITFALTNLQTNEEAEIFGLSAFIAAKRQSLSSQKSAFFMDEASVFLRFLSLSLLIGRLCATARKSGCRIILAGQDINSIADSKAGVQILQNMPCRLIGWILAGAAQSYQTTLGIPLEIISQNEGFQPNKSEAYTRWLLDYNNTYTACRYYPSFPLLALTANNKEEQAMRDSFKAKYSDKFDWLTAFYRYYKSHIKQGGMK
jgi:Helicase HerA, central domain